MNASILGMNRTVGERELETSPELSAKIAHNNAIIRQYKACFGNDAAIALFVAFKDVREMVVEMDRQLALYLGADPCDMSDTVTVPSTDDPAHLARHGF